MKKKLRIFFLLALSLLILVACGKSNGGDNPLNGSDNGLEEIGIIERWDEEKLVKVTVEDGEASIYFDMDRWNELYDLDEYLEAIFEEGILEEGPFPIKTISGKIKDVLLGQVDEMDYRVYDFTCPSILFLMDDGSLEWMVADPLESVDLSYLGVEEGTYQKFSSIEKFVHKDKYVSFSLEDSMEGVGGKSIYAETSKGERANIYYLKVENFLNTGSWFGNLREIDINDETMNMFLTMEDGEATMDIAWGSYYDLSYFEIFENWSGQVEFVTAEGKQYPPGTLIFDLDLGWTISEGDPNQRYKINSTYRVGIEDDMSLSLFHNDGDLLTSEERAEHISLFNFLDHLEEYRDIVIERPAILDVSRYVYNGIEFFIDWVDWAPIEGEEEFQLVNHEEESVVLAASFDADTSLMMYFEDLVDREYMDLEDFAYYVEATYRRGRVVADIVVDNGVIVSIHEIYMP